MDLPSQLRLLFSHPTFYKSHLSLELMVELTLDIRVALIELVLVQEILLYLTSWSDLGMVSDQQVRIIVDDLFDPRTAAKEAVIYSMAAKYMKASGFTRQETTWMYNGSVLIN